MKNRDTNRIIPTNFVSRSLSISIKSFAPIIELTIEIAISGGTIFHSIFFALQNLIKGVVECGIPPNLLVAIAMCGGNPKKIRLGIEINPPPPEIAPINDVAKPTIRISIIVKGSIYLNRR